MAKHGSAGHIAWLPDNRWTIRATEWTQENGPENRAIQKYAREMISPNSLDLHG